MSETSKFQKYLGVYNMTVNGEELELKPRLKHTNKLLAIMTRSQSGGQESQTINLSDDDAQNMGEIFLDIMKASYPDEDPNALENFIIANYTEFMQKLFEAMNWADTSGQANTQGVTLTQNQGNEGKNE